MQESLFDVETYRRQVEEAAAYIRERTQLRPRLGIILGTGLGELAREIEAETTLSYDNIPHFPLSTVESHRGRLIVGHLSGVPVYALQGRFHLYEGYTPRQVTFPVRVLATLGIDTLFISNAAGGMNPLFRRGDLMLITDHINLQGQNPLVGPNIDDWGPRFPDMSEPYDPELRRLAEEKALALGIKLQQGVYVAVLGPNLETRAEYRFLRLIGADAVGMSTVPEVIVARHMNLRVMAISVITDECFPDALEPLSLEAVLAAAAEAEPRLTRLMKAVVEAVGQQAAAPST
ncbi:purine nucleoside phosphorylase I, inosine and guanosine-specific [Rhodothermus marinus SG0.5JP17-172]|uniref:purine-nucleoside phosphorylase n=1 Tax=Rhodothermus marinus TaxID=29549 RepID=UPI000223DC31|nr:purine-nucleoside phosphorylase [Rhodothermus marinus]AEN72644.1 purine nucleoside phosphorylase I, inosine and guanosine-specific [Rhodothermus marinus SG0.5JP17-172]MBO2490684.1 purine-nucleoside phosphorylase [Rhodothermus marinus]